MKVRVNVCLVFAALILIGCGAKTMVLENGISRVPVNQKAFKNKIYFDASLLTVIDTTKLYVQESPRLDSYNSYYRFYGNGNVNLFHFYNGHSIKAEDLNPAKGGSRGVYYTKNGKIHIDLFTIVGYGFNAMYGVATDIVIVEDERLMMYDDKNDLYPDIFIKQPLPADALQYKAEW